MAPVFVFLFLKKYGTNQFELPIYYEDGNPLAECDRGGQVHELAIEILLENDIQTPVLFYIPAIQPNKYYSDLKNVLQKHSGVNLTSLIKKGSSDEQEGITSLILSPDNYLQFINCELILGEDRWLQAGIGNKYVLIDNMRRIRGYFDCTQLSEIERLDTELDILLNY